MSYTIIAHGESRSFPTGDVFLTSSSAEAEITIHIGGGYEPDPGKIAVLVELGTESLGAHTGEQSGEEGDNTLGFARFRNGEDAPSNLIELVRQPNTDEAALKAAKELFEGAGFEVAVCSDQAGRIIDRLVRPKYNYALRFLDEGLAAAKDIDFTCRMGLGYADGPIERVERGGLLHHYEVSQALFETYGTPAYAPARRAVVAKQRADKDTK
ncbi:MAG: 3-hydroxyacyl-CoA dehydrogenase family protein [Pseudomonadota bacterium]